MRTVTKNSARIRWHLAGVVLLCSILGSAPGMASADHEIAPGAMPPPRSMPDVCRASPPALSAPAGDTLSVAAVRSATAREGDRVAIQNKQGCLAEAVRLLHEEQMDAALEAVEALYTEDPGFVSASHGSVAYWMGETLDRAGRQQKARRVRQQALRDSARVQDARLYAARLRTLLLDEGRPQDPEAAASFLRLVQSMRPAAPQWEKPVLKQYALQMAPLLPADVQERTGVVAEEDASWSFRPDAGNALRAWWQQQDPVIATATNERLREHMQRLAVALSDFADPSRTSGLDDRGLTFLQYGLPRHRHSIPFNDAQFFQEVFRFGIQVTRSQFPQNEIWTYTHIDDSGRYIFVKPRNGEGYRLATASDLLPRRLRSGFNASNRGMSRAYSSVHAQRYVYEALSMHYSGFGNVYEQLQGYIARQESAEAIYQRQGRRSGMRRRVVAPGPGGGVAVYSSANLGIDYPDRVARSTVRQTEQQERQLKEQRARDMPNQHSSVLDELEDMPIAVRTARYLEGDSMRVEVYWGATSQTLRLSDDAAESIAEDGFSADGPHLLHFWSVDYTPAYQKQGMYQKRYFVEAGDAGRLAPQTVVLRGDTSLRHLHFQFFHHVARGTSLRSGGIGPAVQVATFHADSVKALRTDRLEMSDLTPMVRTGPPESPDTETRVHPFREVASGTPLMLRFEIYRLGLDANDRTQYTVEYEVKRRVENGRLVSLFTSDREERTATEATYQGTQRTVEEAIVLDLGDAVEETTEATVTVRVTDGVTGRKVERVLPLTLEPPAEP